VHSVVLPDNANLEAAWGPHLYGVLRGVTPSADQLLVADMTNGTVTSIDVPLGQGERISNAFGYGEEVAPVATDGDWIAVVVWRRVGPQGTGGAPCSSDAGQPLAWRILVAPIDRSTGLPNGQFREVQRGESQRTFTLFGQGEGCSGPRLPRISLAKGRLAYDVEDPSSGRPDGSRIAVHWLDGSKPDLVVPTTSQVVYLALSNVTVAWTESVSDPGTGVQPSWDVQASTDAAQAARVVDLGADPTSFRLSAQIRIDEATITWTRVGENAPDDVWLGSLSADSVRRVSPEAASCEGGGIAGGVLGLLCSSTSAPSQTYILDWSSAADLRVLLGLPSPRKAPLVSEGWLTYEGDAHTIFAIEVGSLRDR